MAAFTVAAALRGGSAALPAPRAQPPAAFGEPAAPAAPAGGLASAPSLGGVATVAAVAVLAARRARPLAAPRGGRGRDTASLLRAEPVSAAAAVAAAAKAAAAAGASKAAGAFAASGAAAGVGVLREGKTAPGLESYKPFGEGPFDPQKQVGAIPPLGFWDPAGLCTDEATFRKYRTAEIKHARVAMMAAIGLTAAHGSKFAWIPEGTPAGFAALEEPAAAQAFGFLFLTAGFYELTFWKESESRAPGDFGDPAGWTTTFGGVSFDDELRNRELANGRFSMFAVIGILVAEQQTGLDGVDQLNAAIARWQTMGGFENF